MRIDLSAMSKSGKGFIVLTIEMLRYSLIQHPASPLLICTHLYLYLSLYEQPCNEFDREISESVEVILVMLWNCSLSKLLAGLF